MIIVFIRTSTTTLDHSTEILPLQKSPQVTTSDELLSAQREAFPLIETTLQGF
jgi:hypothetical protein